MANLAPRSPSRGSVADPTPRSSQGEAAPSPPKSTVRELRRGDALLLPDARYGISITWDCVGEGVDLDLQAVVVNHKGEIIDAVYHNNPIVLRASVMHSGDDTTGETDTCDETIWVDLPRLPEHVRMVIFVVGAYSGHMSDAVNGTIHVMHDSKGSEVAQFVLMRTKSDVGVVAMLDRRQSERAHTVNRPFKKDENWRLSKQESFAKTGRHFMDIIEPTIGDLIRRAIPNAPKAQRGAFTMEKGSVLRLPAAVAAKRVFISLVWDLHAQSRSNDKACLHVSAVFFDADGRDLGAIDEENEDEVLGVRHSGSGLTGSGIAASLESVPAKVEQIFLVGNAPPWTQNLQWIANLSCRVADLSGAELASYDLDIEPGQTGLMVARLFREPGDASWGFQIIGSACVGQGWVESLADLKRVFEKAPRELRALGPGPQDPGARRPHGLEVPQDDDPRPPDPEGAKRNWRDTINFREHDFTDAGTLK
eukprot:TRINITY_DN9691_c0_g1_i1.p1 TRINITY_DN9691_c0_g1~~TRINITY_DN9691_c0_g1_i1.p1  ORF type:complete len:479 (-),score=54.45 TRINITY_DN9691_c0_g1_i1:102-1538(-)